MNYCPRSVEKYIFSKVYDTIFPMYLSKNEDQDNQLQNIITNLKKLKGRNLMVQLEFKERYIIVTPEEEKLGKLGYDSSIHSINKLEQTIYPYEKLASIMQMYAEMKTAVIDFSKGKAEIEAMDDQMPAFVYIMAMCDLTHPLAEMDFLLDYLRCNENSYDTEQLLVTNIQVILILY